MAIDVDVQAIIDQANANDDVEASATAALNSLFAQLQAAINAAGSLSPADRLTLQNTVAAMKSKSADLGAAIANDVVAPPPPPPASSVR